MAGLESTVDMFDLRMSESVRPLYDAVKKFIAEEVEPITAEYFRLGEGRAERWGYGEGQLELLETVKAKAKATGPVELLPPRRRDRRGPVEPRLRLHRHRARQEPAGVGVPQLLRRPTPATWRCSSGSARRSRRSSGSSRCSTGEIRSAYAMTEPDVASSDAKNIACRAVRDGDEWVINGEKYYISGAGDPRCKIMIVMVQTNPDAAAAPAPVADPRADGHARRRDPRADARVRQGRRAARPHAPPLHRRAGARTRTCCSARAAGFEISQVRLGPGRIHHCMRSIGAAERALELMAKRGLNREAFGKRLGQPRQEHRDDRPGPHRDRVDAADGAHAPPRRWTSSATPRPGCG